MIVGIVLLGFVVLFGVARASVAGRSTEHGPSARANRRAQAARLLAGRRAS